MNVVTVGQKQPPPVQLNQLLCSFVIRKSLFGISDLPLSPIIALSTPLTMDYALIGFLATKTHLFARLVRGIIDCFSFFFFFLFFGGVGGGLIYNGCYGLLSHTAVILV